MTIWLTCTPLVISQPEQTYRILIDGAEVAKGSIAEDVEEMTTVPPWSLDPSATKPDDWVDEATVEDPEDKKPEDWDENENWSPVWFPIRLTRVNGLPLIPNPAYKPDPTLAVYKDLAHLGFDLWQVNSGTIFDNILVTDDFSEAQRAIDTLFTPSRNSKKLPARLSSLPKTPARKWTLMKVLRKMTPPIMMMPTARINLNLIPTNTPICKTR